MQQKKKKSDRARNVSSWMIVQIPPAPSSDWFIREHDHQDEFAISTLEKSRMYEYTRLDGNITLCKVAYRAVISSEVVVMSQMYLNLSLKASTAKHSPFSL